MTTRKKIKNLLIIAAVAVTVASCGSYQKIISGEDNDLKYQTALEFYSQKKNNKAINLFNSIAPYYRTSSREDTISFYTAVSYFRSGNYLISSELLNEFKRNFPRSPFTEESEYLLAMSYYYASPKAARDQYTTRLAIMSFSEFLSRYPNSPREEECHEHIIELTQKLYDKELLNARVYYDIEYYRSAIHALKVALEDYPETNHREEILYLILRSHYLYAENSIESLQRGRYLNMIDAYYNLIYEFPDTPYMKDAQKMYTSVRKKLGMENDEEVIEAAAENLNENS
ncbi:MAG: outer membrane protein assembly factor BamD [Rikenellaceae bacterium]|nr:outer membrane protein assembly factor BamD [Rikenellaceae bacterium]